MDELPPLDADYVVESPLGRGGVGVVLRARERGTGRRVALKCTQPRDETARARFLREGRVAAQLRHPGIVNVHRVGTWGGQLCLVYELVPGARPLDEAFAELELPGRLDLLAQTAEALASAHAAGLVHRDIKGDNVLVDQEGRARVADFGLATGADLERLTRTGALLGTPRTMAPEQINGRPGITPAADVWALGVLLYQALCGRLPFEDAETLLELSVAIASARFEPPSALAPETPPALERLCLRALQPDPARRLPDGAAFAAGLAAARAEPEAKRSARGPLVLIALAILGLALCEAALELQSRSQPPAARASPVPASTLPLRPTATPSRAATPLSPLEQEVAAIRNQPFRFTPLPARLANFAPIERSSTLALTRDACNAGEPSAAHSLAKRLLPAHREEALDLLRWGARCGDRLCRKGLLRELTRPEERAELLGWLAVHAELGEPDDVYKLALVEDEPGELGRVAAKIRRSLPLERQLHLLDLMERDERLDGPRAWARLLRALPREQDPDQLRRAAGPLLQRIEHGLPRPDLALLEAGLSRAQLAALCLGLCESDAGIALAAPLIRERLLDHERVVVAFRARVYARRKADAYSAQSFAWLEALPRSGAVLNELGKAWLWGYAGQGGGREDRARGRKLLREAIQAGNTEAIHHLYASYRWDPQASPAEREATRAAAIEQDNTEAMQEQAGVLHERGRPEDLAAAEALLREAVELGSSAARWQLADVHRSRGEFAAAERLLLQAAEARELPAMERLALMLEKGQPRLDLAAAAQWRERAALRLHPESMRRLAAAHLAGRAFPPQDPARRARLAEAARDPRALRELAGELPAERAGLSIALLFAAAEAGDRIAASALVQRFWEQQPYQLRRLSASWQLDAHALRRMARIYAQGRGGPRDTARANALRERARQTR